MAKSPEMEKFLNDFSKKAFGRERRFGLCATCGAIVQPSEFRDAKSLKEYGISFMCQKCQDDVFGVDF